MSNVFVNLPVPAANGSGAAVDVSPMGGSKTISLAGPFVASVTIEVSNEVVPTSWAPLTTFNTPDGIVIDVACLWMRATVRDYKSGTPACDVGSDNTRTTAYNLPATTGNGNGTAVDVNKLPLFKTVVVGGTYRGNVQIEVSEDGVSNWSQIGFGFPTPGLASQLITAHYMRVVRSGVPLIDPGLPIVNVGACEAGGGGGGGAMNAFTFRPDSGLTGPFVFDNFNDLYDAFVTARDSHDDSGKYLIIFDDQDVGFGNPVIVDSGTGDITYDLEYATLIGVHEDANVDVRFQSGGGEGDALTIENALWWEGVDVRFNTDVTMESSDNQTFTLTRTTWTGAGGAPVLQVRTGTCIVHLNDESAITRNGVFPAGVSPIQVVGSILTIHANGANCSMNANALNGAGATVNLYVSSSSARVDFYQADVGGLDFAEMNTAAGYWTSSQPSTDPNGTLHATKGTLVMDGATGYIWRNTDGAYAWTRAEVAILALPEQWAQNDVPANQAAVALSAQVSTNYDTIQAVRAGSIVGLSVRFTEAITLGQATVIVTKNGVATALQLVSTSGSNPTGGVATSAPSVISYAAGDLLGVKITTNNLFAPNSTDVEAWVEVAEAA